ncbi:PLP-dependent aminotransferase family protein [Aliikangiella coralliicola]|uniref:PLP-dependent aminotransferase family protein n=1 Tax=Aliikangiella coralliicola TaxID=2592383 RepID=A0A545UK87_9GAMM|nr:PLP-dependent aminotransferase family protein [Aliikangiella coralliicola]
MAKQLQQQIDERRLMPGERLPSVRQLSKSSELSKNTVIKALHTLEAAGVVEARPKTGYFVKAQHLQSMPRKPKDTELKPTAVEVPDLFQEIMMRSAAFDVLPGGPETEPSLQLITLNRHLGRALRHKPQNKAMYYDAPLGLEALRFQIKEHYRTIGLNLATSEFCITSGCQHALFLALLVSCQPGDNVAVESPAFYGVLQLLQQLRLNVIEIPASPSKGISVESLTEATEKWKINACVVTPAYATPTGASMPEEHKKQIINLANQHDITVIEDDIYGDLCFGERPPPLKAFDTEERVILCSSFSKSLSRDLRVGWIVGGRWQNEITRLKLVNQLASNQSIQEGLTSFIAEGNYRRHLYQYRQVLKRQRDQLVLALRSYWPDSTRFSIPDGGLSLWIEMEESVDTKTVYQIALKQEIVLTPGALFSADDRFSNYLRLSFAHPAIGDRLKAIRILGDLFERKKRVIQ